jgi:hypothetical protein
MTVIGRFSQVAVSEVSNALTDAGSASGGEKHEAIVAFGRAVLLPGLFGPEFSAYCDIVTRARCFSMKLPKISTSPLARNVLDFGHVFIVPRSDPRLLFLPLIQVRGGALAEVRGLIGVFSYLPLFWAGVWHDQQQISQCSDCCAVGASAAKLWERHLQKARLD